VDVHNLAIARDNHWPIRLALLHGFIKKSQKTPLSDLELARDRKNLWLSG
jgi:phage-related protein